jgi:hypothetical protein
MNLPPYLFPILPAPLADNNPPTPYLYYSLALLSPFSLTVPPLLLQPRRSHIMLPTFLIHGCRRRYIVRSTFSSVSASPDLISHLSVLARVC